MMKFLALTLYLLARTTLTLISSSAIIGCFQNVNCEKGINLVIQDLSCHLHFCMSHVSHSKNILLYAELIAFQLKLGTACFLKQTAA